MTVPTEPIGSIPRPAVLIDAVAANGGRTDAPELEPLFEAAIRDTIDRFQATGSPVITDGEQREYHNFWDYCVRCSATRPRTSAPHRRRTKPMRS